MILRYSIISIVVLTALVAISGCVYLQHDKSGRLPERDRLARIRQSPHYRDGIFHNQVPFREIVKGGSGFSSLLKYLFHPRQNPEPAGPVPTVKTDLKGLDRQQDVVVWLGHSSYFVQLGGKTFLIDPVFSDYASPIFFSTRAFAGSNHYTADDMPDIDYLLISHDHWDHLDYDTVMALKPKIGTVVTALGVGEHFARWGFADAQVIEADWDTDLHMGSGVVIHVLTARHFSGRLLDRNRTLWCSFALEVPGRRIFYSGDSGYGPHFAAIGERFDGFNLALLDCGQYNENWPDVHMMPEQAAQAALDMRAKAALPGHDGKFSISYHSWNEPFLRFTVAANEKLLRAATPRIGEALVLESSAHNFSKWWE